MTCILLFKIDMSFTFMQKFKSAAKKWRENAFLKNSIRDAHTRQPGESFHHHEKKEVMKQYYLFIWGFTSLSTLYRSDHDG